ncbi:hypothetical protein [Microbacterium halophytorum]|uniref:hypothetical protein n=1 Tax=Microbacterium halophytorum TaxID=2067568 RepID=UPI001319D47D|nr:hypothetical protein [Microbacterium halophytorum]
MRGKVGLVIGLGVGYVLGTRAGRQRYEQIKAGAEKVWNLDPVQKQVGRAKDFAATSAMKLPRIAWVGVVNVAKAAGGPDKSAGQRLDAAVDAAEGAVDDVKRAADD